MASPLPFIWAPDCELSFSGSLASKHRISNYGVGRRGDRNRNHPWVCFPLRGRRFNLATFAARMKLARFVIVPQPFKTSSVGEPRGLRQWT
jgi:hypothetical protein